MAFAVGDAASLESPSLESSLDLSAFALASGLALSLSLESLSLESLSLESLSLESPSAESPSLESSSAFLTWTPIALKLFICVGVNRSGSTLRSMVPWTMLCARKPTVANSLLSLASTVGS